MMKTFRTLILAAVLALALTAPMAAQTTVNTTTLSAAVTKSQTQVTVASATNVAVGNILYVDREAMKVTALSGTLATVRRGMEGTAPAAHVSGAVLYTAAPQYFYVTEVSGACTSTEETALPHVSVTSGNIYVCASGTWKVFNRAGFSLSSLYGVGTTYTASGAITVEPGIVTLNAGSALAMTLVDPTVAQNGMVMIIRSATAQAHTVTYTAGFNGGTTARDVATYSVIGSTLIIMAINGNWCVISAATVAIA